MPLSVITGLMCVAGGTALLAMWATVRSHLTPEKRERRRRFDLNVNGRLGDALLTEFHEDTLYYTYEIRGVHYAASQDIGALREHLPDQPERLGGPVNMKYSSKNPANSILLCEEWSGLRVPRSRAAAASASSIASAGTSGSVNGDGIGHQAQDSALTQGTQG